MDKILVSIYVLTIDETYDIYIPINKNAKEALDLVQKEIVKLSNDNYVINEKAMLYTDNGTVINTNNIKEHK